MSAGSKPLVICDYDRTWPTRFRETAAALRARLGDEATRIDHIGSTAVPGLGAKDVIDIQVTVTNLGQCDSWPDELLPGLVRHAGVLSDHIPLGPTSDSGDWAKRYWSKPQELHVHVREQGRPNQRYALLFRDFLRADALAAWAYEALKRALADAAPDDWATYYAVKDPACDLIIAGAQQWAERVGWTPPPSDS